VDLLYDELGPAERRLLLAHLQSCEDCCAERGALQAIVATADRWTVPAASGMFAERALGRVLAERGGTLETARVPSSGSTLQRLLEILLVGTGAASVSLLLVSGGLHEAATPFKLALVGAIWAVLYAGAMVLTHWSRYRHLAIAALMAAGGSVVLAALLPVPTIVHAFQHWLESAQGAPLLNVLLLLAGLLYMGIPAFVAGMVLCRGRTAAVVDSTVRLAAVYIVLVGPLAYLQCEHLAVSLAAPWVVGIVLGAGFGSLSGLVLAGRLSTADES
jgi:hypothetical protein